MKILHVIDSLIIGGRERRFLELLKGFRRFPEIKTVVVVLSDKIHFSYARNIGVKIICLPRKRRRDFTIFRRLYHVCQNEKPDIIHSWESMCSVYALPVAKLLNIRFINGIISDASKIGIGSAKWVRSRITFPFSDVILANSRAGLHAYKAPSHKSAYVHNGFDFKRISNLIPAGQIRRTHNIHTPKVIGMVATIDHRKDHLSYTRNAIEVCTQRNDVSFIAIGDGPLIDRYRQMVPKNLFDRILFLGSQSNIESYIQIFDIGMLLSHVLNHGEGISNSIIEYMALSKPVIATRAGGTPELVVHGKTGFLTSTNTGHRLSQYIHQLLDNPETSEEMGRAGKHRIQTHFSLERMCSETLALYRYCLTASQTSLLQYAAQATHGSRIIKKPDLG